MTRLNINIDHVATLRNARGGIEPEPVAAAAIAELAGAQGIVCHLREDRRHINDRDLRLVREIVQTKLDLEMANVEEIVRIAFEIKPELVTIVPEKRQELTTEGGLNVKDNVDSITKLCDKMHDHGIEVSLFVEPDKAQIEAALTSKADMVELHTGTYANKKSRNDIHVEFERIKKAVKLAKSEGLQIAAGHGLNYFNTQLICSIEGIDELSIGHSIMSRSIFVGLDQAIREMLDIISENTIY